MEKVLINNPILRLGLLKDCSIRALALKMLEEPVYWH